MLKNFEKFSFPSIEKRWTKDKETDGKKEKKKKRKNEIKKKKKKRKKRKERVKRCNACTACDTHAANPPFCIDSIGYQLNTLAPRV